MTRQEFIDSVTDFYELTDFCRDWDLDICGDVYSEDDRDSYLNEVIHAWACDETWQSVRDMLDHIVTGYDWYRRHYDDEWEGIDDEFEDYKDRVIDFMDENAYWDDEEDEEEEEDEQEEESQDITPIEEEDITIGELFSLCSSQSESIAEENEKEIIQSEQEFSRFVSSF